MHIFCVHSCVQTQNSSSFLASKEVKFLRNRSAKIRIFPHQKPTESKRKPGILKEYRVNSMAEKEGFEPSIPFWGIHDFQSCALGQLRDFSMLPCFAVASLNMIQQLLPFVKQFFHFFVKKTLGPPSCRNGPKEHHFFRRSAAIRRFIASIPTFTAPVVSSTNGMLSPAFSRS